LAWQDIYLKLFLSHAIFFSPESQLPDTATFLQGAGFSHAGKYISMQHINNHDKLKQLKPPIFLTAGYKTQVSLQLQDKLSTTEAFFNGGESKDTCIHHIEQETDDLFSFMEQIQDMFRCLILQATNPSSTLKECGLQVRLPTVTAFTKATNLEHHKK
jgi:hypothetical protein